VLIVRQSTARTVTVGPVLDADGVAVTGGVVADFKISKNGGAPAALDGSATLTHRHTGHYSLALTANDLDTVGQAEVVIDDTVNACPMKEVTVLEEAVYDALYAASATGMLPANVTQWLGSAAATPTVAGVPEVDVTHWIGTAAATPTTAGVPEVDVTFVAGVAASAATDYTTAVETTIATLASQVSFTLTDGSADDDAYNNCSVMFVDASTATQRGFGIVSDYTGSTRTVTLEAAPVFTIATTDIVVIYPRVAAGGVRGTVVGNMTGGITGNITGNLSGSVGSVLAVGPGAIVVTSFEVNSITDNALATSARNVIADAVCDEALSGHTTAGTVGKAISDILVDTAEIGAAGAGLAAVPWNAAWDAEVQSEAEDALVAHRLDELLNADSDIDGAAPPTVGSVFHELMTKTAGSFTYDQTTDSLEANRDNIGTTGAALSNVSANTVQLAGQTVTAAAGVTFPTSVASPTNITAGTITTTTNLTNLPSIPADWITAAGIATGAIDADAVAADAVTEIQSGLATAAALTTVDTVVDSILALLDDARTEPGQGAPPVNPDLATKIDYLYKAWRNKKTQTSSTYSLFADDASTVDQKATVSDDATTTTVGEVVSGP
jgi:hypothetical protein